MRFLDTNVFPRFLTRDDPQKAEACFRLLERARRGEELLTTSETVLAEVVYVLASPRLYSIAPQRIREMLRPIVELRGLKLAAKRSLLWALDLYGYHGLDFVDALSVAQMQRRGLAELYSYDRDFDSISGIRRLEP